MSSVKIEDLNYVFMKTKQIWETIPDCFDALDKISIKGLSDGCIESKSYLGNYRLVIIFDAIDRSIFSMALESKN